MRPLESPWLAVGPGGDRRAQARSIGRLHEAFSAGEEVGSEVRAVVKQSWSRSREAGVDPGRVLAPIVMDEREIEERWSAHALYPVLPVLRDLLAGATSESDHMLVISDARGVLMWIEGHHQVIEATHDMHLVCGADWSERTAGTNAMGTALAVDHPVQIFSAEHFNRVVHPWQCSGAPIHDPATGEVLGVVDLTGHLRTAHPHTLALVTAAAGMAEAWLRHEQGRRDEAARDAYLARAAGRSQPSALVRPSGHVVLALPTGWTGAALLTAPVAGEPLALGDGRLSDVEPLDGHDAFVLWCRPTVPRPAPAAAARLRLLGRRPQLVLPDGREVALSRRHAELLGVLALAGRELTAEELTLEVYGEGGKPVTLRAEVSRLRRGLGGLLRARPYGFVGRVESDLADAERALRAGDLGAALALAGERLLPASEAPRIVEARDAFEHGLRSAVLARRDPELLAAWCRSAAGQADEPAARRLLALLPPGDPRRPPAEAQLARLARVFGA